MANTEMFDHEEISVIQARQLRKTIHYLYQRSPFYRDLFDREHLLPADVKTLADLAQLPTTSRADLIREGDRFLCVRPEDVADIMITSGAAGNPCLYKVTEADLSRLAYNELLSAKIVGISEKDVVALTISLDHCSMAGVAAYLGLRRLGATVIRVSHMMPEQQLRFFMETRPTVVMGTPTCLRDLARFAENQGTSLRSYEVKSLVCVDEAVRQRDFQLNELGRYLQRAWNAKPFSVYRSTELATSVSECEAGRGGHIHPELLHVEVVDEHGRPLREGEIGELCVTPFGLTGMPVLRYRTGDYTFVETAPCSCGRLTHRLGPVLGQRKMRLNVAGTTVFPGDIHGIVQGDPEVDSHVLVLEKAQDGSDRLTLLVEAHPAFRQDQLEARIYNRLGVRLSSRIVSEQELRELQMADVYTKPCRLVDRRHICN